MDHNKEGDIIHCEKCGYTWRAQVNNVKACTKCKQYDWWIPRKRARRY